MSCQPHRVTSGQSTFLHVSTLCQANLQNQSLRKHKTYIHKHQTQIFEQSVPSILPLLKEHIRLGHAGCWPFCLIYRYQVKEKFKKGMDKHNIKALNLKAPSLKTLSLKALSPKSTRKGVNQRSKHVTQHKKKDPSHLIWGCTSGGVTGPCVYMHTRWELPQMTRVFVAVLVLRISGAN